MKIITLTLFLASLHLGDGKTMTLDSDGSGEYRGQFIPNSFYRVSMGIDYVGCWSKPYKWGLCHIFDTNTPIGQWKQNGNGPCNCGPRAQDYPQQCWVNIPKDRCGDPDLIPHGYDLDNLLIIDEGQTMSEPPDDNDGGGNFQVFVSCHCSLDLFY